MRETRPVSSRDCKTIDTAFRAQSLCLAWVFVERFVEKLRMVEDNWSLIGVNDESDTSAKPGCATRSDDLPRASQEHTAAA